MVDYESGGDRYGASVTVLVTTGHISHPQKNKRARTKVLRSL
jgi:hypothetical protein